MLFEKLIRIIRANILSKEGNIPPIDQQYQQSRQQTGQNRQSPPPADTPSKEKLYYEALEITPPATFEQIKTAYKKLVRKYHPDLFQNNPQKRQYAEIVTQKINEAYAYFEKQAGK